MLFIWTFILLIWALHTLQPSLSDMPPPLTNASSLQDCWKHVCTIFQATNVNENMDVKVYLKYIFFAHNRTKCDSQQLAEMNRAVEIMTCSKERLTERNQSNKSKVSERLKNWLLFSPLSPGIRGNLYARNISLLMGFERTTTGTDGENILNRPLSKCLRLCNGYWNVVQNYFSNVNFWHTQNYQWHGKSCEAKLSFPHAELWMVSLTEPCNKHVFSGMSHLFLVA